MTSLDRTAEYILVFLAFLLLAASGAAGFQPLDKLAGSFPRLRQNDLLVCSVEEPAADCRLGVEEWSRTAVTWLDTHLEPLFAAISGLITGALSAVEYIFLHWPAYLVIILLSSLGYLAGGPRLASFILAALLTVGAMGYLAEMMTTLSLVVTATLLSLILGIPAGIAKAHSRTLTLLLDPVLDFMQTMPLFVYLIPVVLFFSIGNVPGIIATFVFATPPAVRLTALGIEQIPAGLLEAGRAFGANPWQFLSKIEIPLALPSIMAGVNQTIMLSLSMVVIASMVGAEGLGLEVYNAISRLKVGQGIASGISVVLLAMILDRLTRAAGQRFR